MLKETYVKPEVATEKIEPGALAFEGSPIPFESVPIVPCVTIGCPG